MAAMTEDTLAEEARRRLPAGIAAAIGAITVLAAAVLSGVLFGDAPRSWFGESLGRAPAPGPLADARSLQVPFYEYYAERSGLVVLGSVVRAVGWLATGWALYMLAGAAARRQEVPKAIVYLPLLGGGLSALATLVVDVTSKLSVDAFLDGRRTVTAAQDVTGEGLLVMGQFLGLAGALAAALAFVMVGLNAMRTGLLTRFMGVLAIIVGVLLVFPLGSPIPIVQCFWLAALAVLLLGRWPGGEPPAWRTGKAEPWPSAAEQREARLRDAEGAASDDPEPAAVPAGTARPAGGARKRKRKRRA